MRQLTRTSARRDGSEDSLPGHERRLHRHGFAADHHVCVDDLLQQGPVASHGHWKSQHLGRPRVLAWRFAGMRTDDHDVEIGTAATNMTAEMLERVALRVAPHAVVAEIFGA